MLMSMPPIRPMTDLADQADLPMSAAACTGDRMVDGEATLDALADEAWARHAMGANGFGDAISATS